MCFIFFELVVAHSAALPNLWALMIFAVFVATRDFQPQQSLWQPKRRLSTGGITKTEECQPVPRSPANLPGGETSIAILTNPRNTIAQSANAQTQEQTWPDSKLR